MPVQAVTMQAAQNFGLPAGVDSVHPAWADAQPPARFLIWSHEGGLFLERNDGLAVYWITETKGDLIIR